MKSFSASLTVYKLVCSTTLKEEWGSNDNDSNNEFALIYLQNLSSLSFFQNAYREPSTECRELYATLFKNAKTKKVSRAQVLESICA